MYVMSTAMPKKSSAEPRSFSTTNISTAMLQMQMSGAMKRSGGNCRKSRRRFGRDKTLR